MRQYSTRQWTSGWESCSFELRSVWNTMKKILVVFIWLCNVVCLLLWLLLFMLCVCVCVFVVCYVFTAFWDRFCRIHSLKTNSNSSEKHAEIQNAKLPWFAKHQFATGELLVSILRQDKLRLTSEIAMSPVEFPWENETVETAVMGGLDGWWKDDFPQRHFLVDFQGFPQPLMFFQNFICNRNMHCVGVCVEPFGCCITCQGKVETKAQ